MSPLVLAVEDKLNLLASSQGIVCRTLWTLQQCICVDYHNHLKVLKFWNFSILTWMKYALIRSCLAEIRASCKIGSVLCHYFLDTSVRKWPPLALSLSQWHALFVGVMSMRRPGDLILERISCASQRMITSMTGRPCCDLHQSTYLLLTTELIAVCRTVTGRNS